MTRLSVCLTHFNRRHQLAATLESLAQQTRTPDEVFLWDDCSPEDPSEIAEAFRGRFRKFVYHRNVRNLGMPGNLNAVLAQATGDYVANLHDADEFHPRLLEKWEAALEAHPTAGMVFCGLDATKENPAGAHLVLPEIAELTRGREFFERWFVGRASSPIWGTVMARKSAYDRLLPLDARFQNWADVDLWMRMCREHNIAYVREALITLDNTPTPQRRFSWYRVLLMQEMSFVNIRRMYEGDPVALVSALGRQRKCLKVEYAKLLAGSVRWLDFRRFVQGIALGARVFSRGAEAGDGRLVEGVAPAS
jgi:glycosyltransferase involved in cell wall biosynthesis